MDNAPSSPSKGKLKDFSTDYDDLNPVITYRHFQTPKIGPKHPLRIIALCDCNAFYANCEQVRLGIDPETPLVVLQWGMLIAVNYPARKYGISRMDKVDDALKRCPELVVVHVATYKNGETEAKYWEKPNVKTHKVSLDLYRRESVKIHTMFKELLPTGEVEKASVDEAFIDFSMPVRDILLERYPYLAQPPDDAAQGSDTLVPPPPRVSYVGLGNLIPVDPAKLDQEKEITTEMVEELEKDGPITWHDVGLAIAAELMAMMRREVHEKLGYLTSAGFSRNKFLAKLAASYRKFNTQNILRNSAIPGFLKPMPFQKIRFLGGKLGKALANEYNSSTVGDLLHISIDEMQSKFGENSVWVYELLRGIDRSEVKDRDVINKSMLAAKNLPKPITKASEGPHWIRMLAAELAVRLKAAREQKPGFWPKTINLYVSQGWEYRRSRQHPFPTPRPVTVDLVLQCGEKLWKELVEGDMLWDAKRGMKITHIGLSFTGISWTEDGQRGIEGFFGVKAPTMTSNGMRAFSAGPSISLDVDADQRVPERTRSVSAAPEAMEGHDVVVLDVDDDNYENEDELCSFTCERCHKKITLPAHVQAQFEVSKSATDGDGGTYDVAELRKNALQNLRMEHKDYHFAQDLAKEAHASVASASRKPISGSSKQGSKALSPSRPTKGKKRRGPEPEGIAKFFIKKNKTL